MEFSITILLSLSRKYLLILFYFRCHFVTYCCILFRSMEVAGDEVDEPPES